MSAQRKSYREYVEAALEAEKGARWGEAAGLWDEARRASKTKVARAEAAGKAAAAAVRSGHVDGRGDALAEYAAEPEVDDGPGVHALDAVGPVVADDGEEDRAEDDLHDAEFQASDVPRPDPRAERRGLALGQVLQHERRGRVLAECTYIGQGDWRYDGASYTSISAAANAAAAALGMKSRTLNGWLFWGVEKRDR